MHLEVGMKGSHKGLTPLQSLMYAAGKVHVLGSLQVSITTLMIIAETKHPSLSAMQFVAHLRAYDTWLLQEVAATVIHLRSRAPLH